MSTSVVTDQPGTTAVSWNATQVQEEETESQSFTVENHIWIYTAPLILAFGIVGNVLTIVIKTRGRASSTNVYFTALAAGDMLVVVTGLVPEWLGQVGVVELWNTHPWVCRVELYVYYTVLDFAIWILVAFTCDRVIAVRFPLHKRSVCTARNARVVCVVIFLIANVNAHVFWTRGAQFGDGGQLIGNCRWLGRYFYFESTVRPWLVMGFALMGPFLVLGVSNSVILYTVKRAKNVRMSSTKGNVRNMDRAQRINKRLSQTTTMCMFTSVVFMLLVLPNIVLLIGKDAWSRDNPAYWFSRAVAGQLVYINHSINFLLYSLTGSKFRKELAALCDPGARRASARESSLARTRTTRSTSASSTQFDNSITVSMETDGRKNSAAYSKNIVGFTNNVVFCQDGSGNKTIYV